MSTVLPTSTSKKSDSISWKLPGEKQWEIFNPAEKDKDNDKDNDKTEPLHSYLKRALQMHNVMILAGSGTSLGSVKGPSMATLWDECSNFKDFRETTTELKYKVHTKKNNKETEGDDAEEENNIEKLLSTAEAYIQVYPSAGVVTNFIKEAKGKILSLCSTFLLGANLTAHEQFLNKLASRRQYAPRVKIFTTNYDLCFEKAAGNIGQIVIDGFSFTAPRVYDPRYFDYDILRGYSSTDNTPILQEGVIKLYKLHGSVNWGRVDKQIQIVSNPDPDSACIIYPAKQKYQQSYIQPHLELISQYFATLRQPETCVLVIGFGLNDDHLSEPLLSAIHSNPRARFIFVTPALAEPETLQEDNEHWRRIFEEQKRGVDIALINATFEQFTEFLPDLAALSPEEQLVRAVKVVARDGKE